MTTLAFLSLGFSEMLVLGLVALLVFGGRLPEVMQNLGRSYGKFRRGMNDLTNPIRQEMRKLDVTSPPPPPRRVDDAEATSQPPPLYTPSPDAVPQGDAQEAAPPPPPSVPSPSGGAADEPPPV